MFIKRLKLLTGDLYAQHDYYSNVLELPVHLNADSLEVQAGKTEFIFTQALPNSNGQYPFCFNIPENQFLYAKALIPARIPLLKDEHRIDQFNRESWNSASLYFKDIAP